jgi:hypothetical protein
MITQSELKELLHYDPDTGIFTWKIKTCKKVCVGKIAGYVASNGYISFSINKKSYLAHRLAWLYVNGNFTKHTIDHINGNKKDNRIVNLREATKSENSWNRKLQVDNVSGIKGVYWHALRNKWMARIMVNNKQMYLGSFDDLKIAEKVILESRNKYHREFANHGN